MAAALAGWLVGLGCGGPVEPPPASALSASPAALELGAVVVGGARTGRLTLTNHTARRVRLESVSVEGALSEDVRIDVAPAELLASGSGNVDVVFRPQTEGTRLGTVVVRAQGLDPLTIPVAGTATRPQLTVRPSDVDFGSVLLGGTATAAVTVRNDGALEARIVAVTRDPMTSPELSAELDGQLAVPAGGQVQLQLAYTPTDRGPDQGRLVLVDADPAPSGLSVSVRGQGHHQPFAVSPAAIRFEGAVVSESHERWLEVRNISTGTVTLQEPQIESPEPATPFAVSSSLSWPLSLVPGAMRELSVIYAPSAPGEVAAELLLQSDGAEEAHRLPLSGVARAAAAADVSLWPSHVDFGRVEVGRAVRRALWIGNAGSVAAELRAPLVLVEGPFRLLRPLASGDRLGPSERHALDVEVVVPAVGTVTSTLWVQVEGARGGGFPVTFQAQGVTEAQRDLMSWADLDFGSVPRGTVVEAAVLLQSMGRLPVTIARIDLLDDAAGRFSLLDIPLPLTLDAGRTVRVPVSFTDPAGRSGPQEGLLQVISNDSDRPELQVRLRAATVPPAVGEPQLDVWLTWTSTAPQFGLHLVRDSGAPFDAPGDVSWCSSGPDWGILGNGVDDPVRSVEPGRQRVWIAEPAVERYSVWVHHEQGGGAALAQVQVFDDVGGLGGAEMTVGPGQWWPAGTIDLSDGRWTAGLGPRAATAERCY